MPYLITRNGSKWEVRKKDGGKLVGSTDSETKAQAMVRAIYANEGKKGK